MSDALSGAGESEVSQSPPGLWVSFSGEEVVGVERSHQDHAGGSGKARSKEGRGGNPEVG